MAVEYSMRISRLTVDKHMTVGRRVTMSWRTDAEGAGRDLLLIDRCGGIPTRHPARLSTSPGAGAIVRCDSNPRSGTTTSGRRLPSNGSTFASSRSLSWHPDRPRSRKQGSAAHVLHARNSPSPLDLAPCLARQDLPVPIDRQVGRGRLRSPRSIEGPGTDLRLGCRVARCAGSIDTRSRPPHRTGSSGPLRVASTSTRTNGLRFPAGPEWALG